MVKEPKDSAQLEWAGQHTSGMCEICSHRMNWLLRVPWGRQTSSKSSKKRPSEQKNYATAWSYKCSVVFVSKVAVPVLHCRSEIFCWWCPPLSRQRQTPPGWVRGGGLRSLASTVGTAKQNRHVHTHTNAHRDMQLHQHTRTETKQRKTRKHTENKRWFISFRISMASKWFQVRKHLSQLLLNASY